MVPFFILISFWMKMVWSYDLRIRKKFSAKRVSVHLLVIDAAG